MGEENGAPEGSRCPVLVPLFLPSPLLVYPQPVVFFPLQPLRQPLLVILERVAEHFDVDQRHRFQRPIRRRVDRDPLDLVEDVLAADKTSKDGVLAFSRVHRVSTKRARLPARERFETDH